MSTVRALSWNVNGIRAVHKKGFLDWFHEVRPDILCLQETKAAEEQLPPELREVEQYRAHFSSAVRKGHSGVALYTKTEPASVAPGFGIEAFDSEGRTLIADYGHFVLLNVYFPNGKASPERLRYKMDFYDAFLKFLDTLKAEGKNVVICGDVNAAHKEIDIARPKENSKVSGFLPEERAWMDELIAHGYADTFRMFSNEPGQYTWWDQMTRARDRNAGWRIDYFFVSEGFADQVKAGHILPDVMGSDHCPIGIEITLPD